MQVLAGDGGSRCRSDNMQFRRRWGGSSRRGHDSLANLDPDGHAMIRRHDVISIWATEVDHDSCDRRRGLEAAHANLAYFPGVYGDILDRWLEHRVGEIQHQAIRILEKEWTS